MRIPLRDTPCGEVAFPPRTFFNTHVGTGGDLPKPRGLAQQSCLPLSFVWIDKSEKKIALCWQMLSALPCRLIHPKATLLDIRHLIVWPQTISTSACYFLIFRIDVLSVNLSSSPTFVWFLALRSSQFLSFSMRLFLEQNAQALYLILLLLDFGSLCNSAGKSMLLCLSKLDFLPQLLKTYTR